MPKSRQGKKASHDPVASYARFTMSRKDMTEAQKKEAVEKYKRGLAQQPRA